MLINWLLEAAITVVSSNCSIYQFLWYKSSLYGRPCPQQWTSESQNEAPIAQELASAHCSDTFQGCQRLLRKEISVFSLEPGSAQGIRRRTPLLLSQACFLCVIRTLWSLKAGTILAPGLLRCRVTHSFKESPKQWRLLPVSRLVLLVSPMAPIALSLTSCVTSIRWTTLHGHPHSYLNDRLGADVPRVPP